MPLALEMVLRRMCGHASVMHKSLPPVDAPSDLREGRSAAARWEKALI